MWLIDHHGLENADAAPSPVCAPQFWGPQVGEVYPDHSSLHYHAGQLLDLAAYCMAAYDGGEVSAHMRPPSQTRHCMHECTNGLQCPVVRTPMCTSMCTPMLRLPTGCLLTRAWQTPRGRVDRWRRRCLATWASICALVPWRTCLNQMC